ncbi:enolase C-terminal domain-like protein [Jiangella endophytica]|uniref:enolase C-terminal domain-like protein n=1 Tax=Jiangella endophytica TaxID=1623398 RepID=UPI000E356F70|nr:enolase C-terminal domain-like protein [Jiangella endophytica]
MPTITAVETRVAPFSSATWLDEERIATPLSWYPRFAERRSSWRGPGADVVWVLLRAGDELFGIGQSRGGAVTESAIRAHLAPLLIGQDAAGVVELTDQLRRALAPYAGGLFGAMAVSAVELALWDLGARALGAPLHRILGGHGRPLPHYLTIGSAELFGDAAAFVERAGGVEVVKVPMAYGPADGRTSLRRNVDRVERLRALLPTAVGIAVDCFSSWNPPYAVEFARACEGLGLAWIEEPFAADEVTGYMRLRDGLAGTVRVATGEHLAGVRTAEELIAREAIDVIQTDVTWCGGLGVARTIAALAAEHGVRFVPHASALQPWALHLLSACAPESMAETLVLDIAADVGAPAAPGAVGVGLSPEDAGFGSRA